LADDDYVVASFTSLEALLEEFMCLGVSGVGAFVALSFPLWYIFGFATYALVLGRIVNKCLVTLYNESLWANIYKIR
jgi:hypothetical protein